MNSTFSRTKRNERSVNMKENLLDTKKLRRFGESTAWLRNRGGSYEEAKARYKRGKTVKIKGLLSLC
jgi:hypothetical protein